jgi:CobQ-like glutamine amidotransferase family enzyme
VTGEGVDIPGLNIFPVQTIALSIETKQRCIGNIVIKCELTGLKDKFLVGFENHSGQTYFTSTKTDIDEQKYSTNQSPFEYSTRKAFKTVAKPLGVVLEGYGNNYVEKIEGCVYKNAVGTYMHGSCLPKNPELTDYLIQKALENKIINGELPASFDFEKDLLIDDSIALATKNDLIKKFL